MVPRINKNLEKALSSSASKDKIDYGIKQTAQPLPLA